MEIYFLIHKLTTYTNALGSLCFTAPYYNISVPNTIKRTLYWTVHMQWELAHNTYKYILLCSRLMSTHTQTERPETGRELRWPDFYKIYSMNISSPKTSPASSLNKALSSQESSTGTDFRQTLTWGSYGKITNITIRKQQLWKFMICSHDD